MEFHEINLEELEYYISNMKTKTSKLHPIPTFIIKKYKKIFLPIILHIINTSISTQIFPKTLKHAIITPIIKKEKMNPADYNSFRPISNISFIFKILEKVLYDQLNEYFETNNFHAITVRIP